MHQPIEPQDRLTTPDSPGRYSSGQGPGDWFVAEIIATRRAAGEVWVDQHTALTYSAVWSCVRVISESIAALCWHTYERSADARTRLPLEDDIGWLLGMQANPEVDALNWRQAMLKDALTWGNGYAEIERDRAGRPLWLWRIAPDRVCVERDRLGQLYYSVKNPYGGEPDYLDPSNVFHLKGLSPDGLVGYSPISIHRRAIQLGMATEAYGSQFFSRGPMPGGVLEIPGTPSQDKRTEYRESFERAYGGSHNAGRVVVLWGNSKFSPFSLPNDDAQFLGSRQFSAEEIAGIYGVPPHMIGRLERSTNNNIEWQSMEFVRNCLLAWCRRLECEADVKLYGRTTRGRRFTQLDLTTLLRGDSVAQTETITKQVVNGLRTPNEGREYLGLNPHKDGDELLIQGAMVTMESIINAAEQAEPPEPPEPGEPPGPSTNGNGQGDGGDGQALPPEARRVFGALLADVYSRLLGYERDKARQAHRKGKLARHAAAWCAPDNAAHAAKTILPAVTALLLAARRPAAEAESWAARFAADHCRRSAADLARGIDALAGWADRPAEQAAAHLAAVERSLLERNGHADIPVIVED